MSITFYCGCGKKLKAGPDQIGRWAKCPGCGAAVTVPFISVPPRPQPAGPQALLPIPILSPPRSPAPAESPPPATPPLATPPSGAAKVEFESRRHALTEAQVVPDSARCVQCGICSHNCPVGIDVRAHAWRGKSIFDSHCLTCSECVNRCPRGVLRFEQLSIFGGER
jgi:ferredoxin